MKYKNILRLLLVLWGCTFNAIAQKNNRVTVDVTGSVFDDLQAPLEGVLIINEDGKVAITNQNGEFAINAKVFDQIAFEMDGYDRKVVKVIGGKIANNEIILQRTSFFNAQKSIDIPFAKISSVSSTGSVIRVSGEQLEKHPSGLVLEALTGLIPGLQIRQTSSRPGLESYSVNYHGSSIEVLVDGVPATQNLGLLEVDEVVFMRGASATAFMGEIGADGLLLIKTKRGTAGPRKIMAQAEVGIGLPTSMAEMQNAYEYAQTINQSLKGDGLLPFYDQQALDAYQNHTDLIRFPDVNYNDLVYRDIINRQQYTAQVSGGNDNTKYFANFTYNGMEGLENSVHRRTNDDFKFRSNLDIQLTNFLHLDVGLMGAYKDQHSPVLATGSTMQDVNSIPPNAFPLMLGDSIYITSKQYGRNLKYEMDEGGYNDQTDRVMSINIGLNFDLSQLTEGLSLEVRGSGDVWNQSEIQLNNNGAEYELLFEPLPDGTDSMVIVQTAYDQPDLNPSSVGTTVRRLYNYSGLLSYNKTFGEHAVDAGLLAYLYELQDDNNVNRFKSQSFNLRGNYTFSNKYSAELILNYSGTNKLEKEYRRILLPTIGASWIMSDEDFLKDIDAVDYLKLRGSWGKQGYLTSFSNYYSFLDRWSHSDLSPLFGAGSSSSSSPISNKTQTASHGIDWPVKTTAKIGLDGLFFNNSLSLHADYFNFQKSGLIVRGVMLDMAGGSPYYSYSNQNEVAGNALELGMAYNKRIGEFSYTIGANIGYSKTIRTKYAEPAYTNIPDLREGDATDAIYGLTHNGLFASNEDALNSNQYFGAIFKDDIIYEDTNSDGKVDNRDIDVIGNSDPRINYGVNLSLSYKGISLYLNGAGFAGYDINLNGNNQYQFSGFDSRPSTVYDNLPNGNSAPRMTVLGSSNNYRTSTYWLVPGNFFRLENVELAYKLPAKMAKQWFVKDAKLFVRGKNLMVISKFENSDPEYVDGGFADYPLFKEFSAGINFSF